METISVNQFREQLRQYVDSVAQNHDPLRVKGRRGEDFIVISAKDWEAEQETLYVLQNQDLVRQIAESAKTYKTRTGKRLSKAQQHEIDCI